MVPEGRSGGQDTLRSLSNASLYFPSKFCSFYTVLLHTPRGRPSDLPHLLKRGEACGYQECALPTGPRHTASKPLSSRREGSGLTNTPFCPQEALVLRIGKLPTCTPLPRAPSSSHVKHLWVTETLFKITPAPELR